MTSEMAGYAAMTTAVGWLAVPGRTQVALTGGDRQKFLHNYCTADIKQLQPRHGCEAFLTSVQGKTLGHGLIWAGDDELVIDGEPGHGERWLQHLDRYLLHDDVQLHDWGAAGSCQIWLIGPQAPEILSSWEIPLPPGPLGQNHGETGAGRVTVRRQDRLNVPWLVVVGETQAEINPLRERLLSRSVAEVTLPAWEMVRIEAGWPCFGRDITEQNLPQEVGRDAEAISFTKGCYLGQETVARIDALGHVNRRWTRFRFPATAEVLSGDTLLADARQVGELTSVCYSPRLAATLAVGYIRRELSHPGTPVKTSRDVAGEALPG